MPPRNRPNRRNDSRQSTVYGKTIPLTMIDMAHGGSAIGKHKGQLVFVPYTIPGEEITAKITGAKGSVLFAQGKDLQSASRDRVMPQCAHFGQGGCWNCQWQHIDYRAQLLLKQDVMADQLSRMGKMPDQVIETVLQPVAPSQEQWEYNFHMMLTRSDDGDWGYLRQDGRTVEPMSECHVVHPDLLALYYELDLDFEHSNRMTLIRGTDGAMTVNFELDEEEEPELETVLPISVNIILPDNEPINLIGDSNTRFVIGERDFRVTAGGFIRPNVEQIFYLIGEVLKAAKLTGKEQVLDLYAGVGIFSAFIAPRAELVTLVESYPPAVTDADENLAEFDNIDIIEGQVEMVLDDMIEESAEYDVAIVDPPNSGLSKQVIQQLQKLNVKRIVYVSGDPASLARDSQMLISAGYPVKHIQPMDFAPQTYYIEAVALFEHR